MTAAAPPPDRHGRYDRFFALSTDPLCISTLDGQLVDVNPAWEEVLGWPREELLGRAYLGLVHPDDQVATRAAMAKLTEGQVVQGFENRYRHRDGTWRWLAWSGTPSLADGLVHSVVRDVSERYEQQRRLEEANTRLEQANARLEQLNDRLELAQELAQLGHWQADMRSGELTWSPMMYRIFGLDPTRQTPSLERFRDAVHPDDRDLVRTAEEEAARTGHLDAVHRIVRPDGTVRTVHGVATSVVADDGSLLAMTGTLQDVTATHEAERALRESEAQLARALTASRDGWWEVDLREGTSRCADRWWELHGYEPGQVPSTIELLEASVAAEERPQVVARFSEAFAGRDPLLELRSVARRLDGSTFPVELRVLIEYDPDGTATRISGTTRDLTEVVRSERLQEEFLATVSHELRTPLTSIGGALELLQAGRAGPLEDGAGELLAVASRNTRRLRRLIDDLLDAERLASGRQAVVLRTRRLVPVLERIVDDHVGRPDGGDVELALEVAAPPDLQLPIDPDRIGQVLANYLSNAVRYAPPESLVRVRVGRGEDHVRVGVLDQGPGVPEGFEQRAFTRFSQADPDDARSRGGTGLGLAISREIIERHGGMVGYDSVPGRTEFFFTLPLPS